MEGKSQNTRLPYLPKRPGPTVGDRSSSLPQHSEAISTSPKRANEALIETLKSAKKQKIAAKASRDSLHQLHDLGWWTQDKLMHQASIEELEAQIEFEETTSSKKTREQIQETLLQLEAALSYEKEAEYNSRNEELAKEAALIKAARIEKENIRPGMLSQATSAFLSIVTEVLYPPNNQRSKNQQLCWKIALIVRYNAMSGYKPSFLIGKSLEQKWNHCTKSDLWCPVLQAYKPGRWRTAAHIVPHRLGQTGFELFFGKDQKGPNSSTWSLRNGLILSKTVETLLDDGVIVITPRSSAPGENVFETRVLDHSARDEELQEETNSCKHVRDLHGRKLIFKNNERPGRRYLYLMYCAALYKAARQGKTKVVQAELSGGKQIWATPGPYIREHMIRNLAANMGHDTSMLHPQKHAFKSPIQSGEAAATEVSEYNQVAQFWRNDIHGDEEKGNEIGEQDEIEVFEFLRKDKEWRMYD